MELLIYGIGTILLGGIVTIFIREERKGLILCLFTGAGGTLTAIPAVNVLAGGITLETDLALAQPLGNVALVLDPLAAFFVILISLMSFICTIYTTGYIKPYLGKDRTVSSHFFFLSLLISSMVSVTVIQNALAFLMAWEIMSLSSFFLVVFENEKKEVFKAGLNYLIAMHVGVVFLISAFSLLWSSSGSLDFSSFTVALGSGKGIMNLVFALFFIGFGTKAGFMPLHTWLPKAHPAAPSHVSGLMSGVMIKTGIYGILRVISIMGTPTTAIAYSVLAVSLASGLLGVAYAIAQHNIKKLLAYHSVENIGIIGMGMGIGLLGLSYDNTPLALLGFAGAILHVLNHSIFKSLLFFSIGGTHHKTHTLDIEQLGGLFKLMPFTSASFLIGALAISGLPPLNGFISEFFIYSGMFHGVRSGTAFLSVMMVVSFAGLALIGAMALLCFTKAFGMIYLGQPRSNYTEKPSEVGPPMKTAMSMQILMIVFIGLFPHAVFPLSTRIASSVTGHAPGAFSCSFAMTLSDLSRVLLLFAAMFSVLYLLRRFILSRRVVSTSNTWGCGYQAGNRRMQYTASSFAEPFLRFLHPLFHKRVRETRPQDLFPGRSSYESHVSDKVEIKVIYPLISLLHRILKKFSWIQNGNTQQYLMYGLIFLMVITIWIMVV